MNKQFTGSLKQEQSVVKQEAINSLNKSGSVMISCATGFGKTVTSINIACTIRLKTLIIVNKIVLIKQWENSIRKFSKDSKIWVISAKDGVLPQDYDFYIINAMNTTKMNKDAFNHIGCLIVDEAHLIMAETLSRSLACIYPRYLIGLTATPYRPDGLDSLIEMYFGQHQIIRKLYRKHTVYHVKTGFKPVITLTDAGRVNWGALLDDQASDTIRNNDIVKIIQRFKDRTFLVPVKRVSHGETLIQMLSEKGENVTSLLGKNQTYDKNARILIGTGSKIGTGFDHPDLDALLLAADVEEYFIQFLGRVFRRDDVEPIIFDLDDDYSVLHKHFLTRRSVYLEHGGIIKKYVHE
jgi:superfamily II DNA or RNA helicase